MQGPPATPSYRVYSPTDLQNVAPPTYRSAPPPAKRSFFGIGLVLTVVVLISGATFAAQHFVDLNLSDAGPGSFALSLSAPSASPSAPAPIASASSSPPAASSSAVAATASSTTKAHRKMIRRRQVGNPSSMPPASGAAAETLPGVPGFVNPSQGKSLPANPYDDGN